MSQTTIRDRRPLLIFNHNPKAGGGTLLETFRGFKKECGEKWRESSVNTSSCFVNVREPQMSDLSDQMNGFVISSIREPCSHYLSLWSFGSAGNGTFHHDMTKNGYLAGKMYGQDGPLFSTAADIDRFNVWLRTDEVFGTLQKRMVKSFGQGVPAVDCWVFVEHFQTSFLHCLEMYERQGGWVDWNSKMVVDLAATVAKQSNGGQLNHSHARKLLDKQYRVNKNNITGNPQLGHHAPCNVYFNESTKKMVETGPESVIYRYFHYQSCCSKDYRWSTEPVNSTHFPRAAEITKTNLLAVIRPHEGKGGNGMVLMAQFTLLLWLFWTKIGGKPAPGLCPTRTVQAAFDTVEEEEAGLLIDNDNNLMEN